MSTTPGSIVMLTRLSRLIYKRATEDVLGMRLKGYVTLTNLREGPKGQQELCIALHMDPNNVVLMLNELEASGYVERRRDPADRRRHIVEITPAGVKAMGSAERAMESLEDEVLGALSVDERAVLRDMLARALSAGEPATTTV